MSDRASYGLPPAGRVALFCAALAPASIWVLTQGALARPTAALGWSLACAGLAASLPSPRLRWSAWLQVLALPWTFSWIATVSITGMGPSNAVMLSATEGAFKEVLIGSSMALANPFFLISAALTLAALGWSFAATRLPHKQAGNTAGIVFLSLLIPSSAAVLDGGQFLSFSQIVGPEARTAVPWFSHLALAKEALSARLVGSAYGDGISTNDKLRSAASATRQFDSLNGLGVFIIGESLRADALLREERGPWSRALGLRLKQGLGVRLPDACAGSNSTFGSLPRLLTAVEVGDVSGAAHNPTLLALAKAGGSRTAYINNHEIWVVPETGHDLEQKTSSMEVNAYDQVPIEALSDFVKRAGAGPKAALVNLYGQHFHYEDRYPQHLFAAEPPTTDPAALFELRYARSAEYNVRVLLQAATLLDEQEEPAFLVFTSDHAENLPSDKTGKRFHSGPSTGKFDTTVPVLVLWNRAFAKSGRPHVLDRLAKAQGLIAHRDVTLAWLALQGKPGELVPAAEPMTWGAREPGTPFGPVSCATLMP